MDLLGLNVEELCTYVSFQQEVILSHHFVYSSGGDSQQQLDDMIVDPVSHSFLNHIFSDSFSFAKFSVVHCYLSSKCKMSNANNGETKVLMVASGFFFFCKDIEFQLHWTFRVDSFIHSYI
jgi:hypothetical protein